MWTSVNEHTNQKKERKKNDKEKFFFFIFFISSFVVRLPYGVQPAHTVYNKKISKWKESAISRHFE